jgi:hypothetical protein
MATLIDTLKSQGRPTDYYARKQLYESMGLDKQYGAYTGSASQNIGFQNVLLGGNPSPSQAQGAPNLPSVTSPQPTGQTIAPPTSTSTSKMSENQSKYLEMLANRPSEAELYNKYAEEIGLAESMNTVASLNKTVMDLEKKIADIEPMITQRAKDFVITEAQRQRMTNAEEKPLRDQYLEAARQQNYAEVGLGNKRSLLETRMKYANSAYDNQLKALEKAIAFDKEIQEREDQLARDRATAANTFNPAQLFGDLTSFLDGITEPKPTAPPTQTSDAGGWELVINPQSKLTDNIQPYVKGTTKTTPQKTSSWELVSNTQSKLTDNIKPYVKGTAKSSSVKSKY